MGARFFIFIILILIVIVVLITFTNRIVEHFVNKHEKEKEKEINEHKDKG